MKVTSVSQPWAQLIADRRRHVLVKTWKVDPGELLAIHASHVCNETKAREFGYSTDMPKNAIVAIVQVKRCMDREKARESKFDASRGFLLRNGKRNKWEREYVIAVKVLEKLRHPVRVNAPRPLTPIWECEFASKQV